MPPVNATRQLDRYTAVQYTGTNADEITQHFAPGVYFWYQMQDGSLIYSDNAPDGLARSQTIGRVNVGDWVVSERYNANDWYDVRNGQYGSRTFTVLDDGTYHSRYDVVPFPDEAAGSGSTAPSGTDTGTTDTGGTADTGTGTDTSTGTTGTDSGTADSGATTPTDGTTTDTGTTAPADTGTADTGTTALDSGTTAPADTTGTDTGTTTP